MNNPLDLAKITAAYPNLFVLDYDFKSNKLTKLPIIRWGHSTKSYGSNPLFAETADGYVFEAAETAIQLPDGQVFDPFRGGVEGGEPIWFESVEAWVAFLEREEEDQ